MLFNNMYFPAKGQMTQIEGLLKVPEVVNTYILTAKFDNTVFENEVRQKFPNIALSLASGSNQIQVSGSGNEFSQKFNFKFSGEGIQFKILLEKNADFKNGYISLEFMNGADHPIKNAIEKCIQNCFVSVAEALPIIDAQPIQPDLIVESEVIQKNDSEKLCNCDAVVCHSFGGQAIRVTDFTNYFVEHFRYSNCHEYGLYTCTACKKIWFLQGYYADRPPYVNSAETITVERLKNLGHFTAETITGLMDKDGPQVLNMIVNGELIKVGDLQRKYFPKCQCVELTNESFEKLTRPIESITDSFDRLYSHAFGSSLIYLHQCKLCKTGWVYYVNQAPGNPLGWTVRKIADKKIISLMQESQEKLDRWSKELGVAEFVKQKLE